MLPCLVLLSLLAPHPSPLRAVEPEVLVTRDIRYRTMEGVAARFHSLDVHSRAGAEALPTMVMVHGGGWRTGDKANRNVVRPKAAWFVSRGWVFVSINHRLSPAVRHPDHVDDVAAAVAWVHDHIGEYGGDPDRIHVMGHSSGAHLAALVATDDRRLAAHGKSLSIIRSATVLDGAGYDIPWGEEADLIGPMLEWMFRDAFGGEAARRDGSPATHVSSGKSIPPFLIVHTERHAAAVSSTDFALQLIAADVSAQLFVTWGKSHSAVNRDLGVEGDPLTAAVAAFLDRIERPATSTEEQPGRGSAEPRGREYF